jgi:DnaJ-class molecular chaperone
LVWKIPSGKIDRVFNRFTKRKQTEKLQIIHPIGPGNDPDLYGTIFISDYEAGIGTKKQVYLPVHLKKRLLTVTIPPGVTRGTLLRLNGLGKVMPDNRTGNLILKVSFREEENER